MLLPYFACAHRYQSMNDVETRGSGTPILPLNCDWVKSLTVLTDPLYACVFHVMPRTAEPTMNDLLTMNVLRSNFDLKKFGPTASTTQPFWIEPTTSRFWLGTQMSAIAFFVPCSALICERSTESTLRLTVTLMPYLALNALARSCRPAGFWTE